MASVIPGFIEEELENRTEAELEELAEENLEPPMPEEVGNWDLIYSREKWRDEEGTLYHRNGGSPWYDEVEEIQEVGLEFNTDIEEVKTNILHGEAVLGKGENEINYRIVGPYQGAMVLTRELGEDTYVLRYHSEEDSLEATRLNAESSESQEIQNGDIKKQIKLITEIYSNAHKNLLQHNRNEEEIKIKDSVFNELRPVYEGVLERIEAGENDECKIYKHTYFGSSRGPDIVENFFTAAQRHPEDSPDNYEESDGKGRSTTKISRN